MSTVTPSPDGDARLPELPPLPEPRVLEYGWPVKGYKTADMRTYGEACARAAIAGAAEPALLKLSELMRGLEMDPSSVALFSPAMFYEIGAAIADQAKAGASHPPPTQAPSQEAPDDRAAWCPDRHASVLLNSTWAQSVACRAIEHVPEAAAVLYTALNAIATQCRQEDADAAAQPAPAPVDAKAFEMRVAGPDDVHWFSDELDALRHANSINKQYLADRLKHPDDEVLCVATVHAIEEAPPEAPPVPAAPVDEPVDVDAPQGSDHLARAESGAAAAREADERSLDAVDYATALLDVMDGMSDHDIAGETGLPKMDCDRIAAVRAAAREVVGEHTARVFAGIAAPTGVPQDSGTTGSDE
jgi:hypothetical protein